MITGSPGLANYIEQSQSFPMTQGCYLEYNMNDLIDGVAIAGENESAITITHTAPDGTTYKPFDKLFPLTSIIDPRRPKAAGIYYLISGDPANKSFASTSYASSAAISKRLYFSGMKTAYKYWVTPPSAANKNLTDCILKVTYPSAKKAVTNKITIKFETSHSKPTSWTLKMNGGTAAIYTGSTCPDNGVVNLYYNGSSWQTNEPFTPSAGIDITELKLQINSLDTASAYLGIIEISARYVIDISDKVKTVQVMQSASDSAAELVPVGNVTANSATVSLFVYDQQYIVYDKTTAFDKTKINFYKNIIVIPYIKVDNEQVKLGVFYADSFTTGELGDASIVALDGARELQYIKPPDIVANNMSSVAIIRRLLDSIGFTNYYFNLPTNDTATIKPLYWYTDPNKTVWQHIQDLCQDTQMIASFDYKDVLQFYPRDYIFVDRGAQTSFRSSNKTIGGVTKLSNISSLSVENVPSVKAVKILYSPQLSSSYLQNADNLYTAPVIELGAAALTMSLSPVASAYLTPQDDLYAPKGIVFLEPVVISGQGKQLYAYSGYLVIQKEIIEYDAIAYQYEDVATGAIKTKWMTSESDVQKYQGLAKPNTFAPTNQYRIKTRNAFNTINTTVSATNTQAMIDEALTHSIDNESIDAWSARKLNIKTGASTEIAAADKETYYTMKSVPITKIDPTTGKEVKDNPHNLLSKISRSMLTVFAKDIQYDNTDPLKPKPIPNEDYIFVKTKAKYTGGEAFVIGTNMYFPYIINSNTGVQTGNQKSLSGIAFSLNDDCTSGYLLTVATSQSYVADKKYKDVNFYKITNGKLVPMLDSQRDVDGTIVTNINGGNLYRIDIRGSLSVPSGSTDNQKVLALKILLNNKTIAVVDTSPPAELTDNVALVSGQGISSFDYVYTAATPKEDFLSNSSFDLYKGMLGGESTFVKTLSDFVLTGGKQNGSPVFLKEFGPVARELKRIQTRYSSPGFPRYTKLVQNPDVTVVGAAMDLFTLDAFVMNNTGVFTELSNGQDKSFIVVGDYITSSDEFEYMDPNLTENDKSQQVGFKSTWIQNESDAKKLAEWMTKTWSKSQKVLTMDVFINPLLQIGDVIQVSYPTNKIYSSEDSTIPAGYSAEKFVILQLTTTYDEASAPVTNVVCRSI